MTKYLPMSTLAGLVTFSLFAFMAFLVGNEDARVEATGPMPMVDIVQTPEDSKVENIVRKVLTPPPAPKMAKPSIVETEPSDSSIDFNVNVPTILTSGSGYNAGPAFILNDGDARPIVRIDPKYPIEAARDGKEGWVLLSFSIDKLGAVTNVKVLDAEPKRTFNKAAKQALRKWKYRAKIVDGKPVMQDHLTVQLDFKLNHDA